MNQLYLGINLVAALFLVAVLLSVTIKGQGGKGHRGKVRSGNSVILYGPGIQDYRKVIRISINFPPQIIKLLALSTAQKAQLQAIISTGESGLESAELDKLSAFSALQKAIMTAAFDDGAVKQHHGELVAATAKYVQVNAEMFAKMRQILTFEQVTRLRPKLPLEHNDFYLKVQLPEGLSDVGLSGDQQSQLQTVIHRRDQEMVALSRKAQSARLALEQAIFSERFDEAAVNQRRGELIALLSEQLEVNTGILLDARKVLTLDQLKRLDEMMPDQ